MEVLLVKAPVIKEKPYSYSSKFESISDPYFWLREKENPEVISYIKEENAYLEHTLKDTNTFQKNYSMN